MRNLLSTALVFLTTVSSFAQKFEIGINGGIGLNAAPYVIAEKKPNDIIHRNSDFSSVMAVKALYNHNKWQYGAEVGIRQLSYKTPGYMLFAHGFGPEFTTAKNIPTVFISKQAIPFKLFANRKIVLRHLETYAGISAGYILATKCEDPNALAEQYFDKVNGNGFSFGLHVGSTWFITKRLGINAEAGGDYMNITVGAATYKLFAFPGTLGVRYKL